MLIGDLGGRDVLLLSPHSDDIAYSLCGRLLTGTLDPETCALVTVFSISQFAPFANPPLAEPAAITALRAQEDRAYASALGLLRMEMGLQEAPIRDGLTDLEHLFVGDHLAHPYLDQLTMEIRPVLAAKNWSQIYLPLGLGSHIDHRLLREAVQRADTNPRFLRYYEDLPYAGEMADAEYNREVARLTTGLVPEVTRSGPWIERKIELLHLYSSQVQQRDVEWVLEHTRRIGGERIWLSS